MLTYLIPSRARRQLLAVLYKEAGTGTVSALARRADLSTASAQVELAQMERAGLAQRLVRAGRREYQAVPAHPHTELLRALLALPLDTEPNAAFTAPSALDPNRTRADLAAHGARLAGYRAVIRTDASLEHSLARGAVLARDDVEVARALPALIAKHAATLDYAALDAALHELRHKHTAGFLLALAAQLTNNPTLAAHAEALRDRRRKRVINFFSPKATPEPAPDTMTLDLATHWNFWFPLPLAAFPK